MENTHIRFQKDDNDSDYNPSDSDDDYTEREKDLLQKVRNRKLDDSESENEVFGVGSEEGSDDHKSDIAISDIEGQDDDDDDLPNDRAWGTNKKNFYHTDYVDPDYGGFQGNKDAVLAELEEEEAKNLQKQLVQQLDDNDFSLEMFVKKKEPEKKEDLEEIIKTDVTKLSKRQKLQLLEKESPEFFELIEDFKVEMTFVKETLKPILDLVKDKKVEECEATDFIKFYYRLILNYCTNISMYLLLKASKVNLKSHPIVKRLFQYRQYIMQVKTVFDEILTPQLEIVMKIQEDIERCSKKSKTLKLLAKLTSKIKDTQNEDQPPTKKTKENISRDMEEANDDNLNTDEESISEKSSNADDVEMAEDEKVDNDTGKISEKRAITYQMAKNKGLTPHRKKEQRNPRVKHRNKFRKAKIRRKGAVREVRRELSRYGGEMSGIKASVTKSIKLK